MHVVRTASVSFVVAAMVAFAAAPAQAQDAEKARQLFQQGSKYYDLGQFDKAIEAWQQGYDQKPDPGFLYNIAQAHRQKQDAAKAIFFYKGYLRNSPKAQNRVEVEKKIAELQKQLDAGNPQTPPTTNPPPPPTNGTTPPPTTNPPPPPSTLTTTPTEPPPLTTAPPPTYPEASPVAVYQAPEPPTLMSGARFDAMASIGPAFWQAGVNGTAKPSFVLTLTSGYTFGNPTSRFRFRLGGLFNYTFLGANEDSSNVTFLSLLIDPTLDVRLTQSGRLYLSFDFGLGVQMLFGLKPRSKLLAPSEMLVVNGVQSLLQTRLGATFGYRLTPELALFTTLAQMSSPKKQHFFEPITRVEWLFGVAYRY
jgi:hypothetical protein